ncbi:MAG: acyltransferase [Actinotalea sp.]|nr:acyltransferase [Actinotalea sp.]
MRPPPAQEHRRRDRVLDAVRAAALLVVVVAHALAWDTSSGAPRNVLDGRPGLVWVTWLLQPLPLLFAAGGLANLGSWQRDPDLARFLHRRGTRLLTPAVVYLTAWTVLLLPLAVVLPEAAAAGRFLSQLVWFLGVYLIVVLAVPWTSRWTTRPGPALATWLVLVAVVDALRWNVSPVLGWLNLLLVWGFCHQLGTALPLLRRAPAAGLLAGAGAAAGTAVGLAVLGPWSSSLVSYAGDPEPTNLAPPTVVVALYGLGQVLLLAAVWGRLERALTRDRLYVAVAGLGTRGIGLYLWHIPVVALVAGTVLLLGGRVPALGPVWWALHGVGLVVVLAGGWTLAGLAGRVEARLRGVASRAGQPTAGPTGRALAVTAGAAGLALLHASVTGFGRPSIQCGM